MIRLSLVILVWITPLVAAANQFSYSVGNSLTWDANPPRVSDLATLSGETLTVGYHIRCGSSLTAIYNDPLTTCITPTLFGRWDQALASYAWDIVTLQTHPGVGSTLASDASVALSLMQETLSQGDNNTTQFYIYATYARTDWFNDSYHEYWWQPVANEPTQMTLPRRDYYQHLIDNLRQQQATILSPILLVPAGDVIDVFDQLMVAGQVPGLSSAVDLYRDQAHLNNVGRFLLSHTWYATIFGTSPIGLDSASLFPASASWPTDQTITPELADQLQRVVWNVVRSHAYSGVGVRGDINGDGIVTAADAPLLVQALVNGESLAFPGLDLSVAGDVNMDGVFDTGDITAFNVLLIPASAESVPEPSAMVLAFFALAGFTRRPLRHVSSPLFALCRCRSPCSPHSRLSRQSVSPPYIGRAIRRRIRTTSPCRCMSCILLVRFSRRSSIGKWCGRVASPCSCGGVVYRSRA